MSLNTLYSDRVACEPDGVPPGGSGPLPPPSTGTGELFTECMT